MTMSEQIKELIAEKGMTQKQVAMEMQMDPTLFNRMLRDQDHNYTVKTLKRIADALGIDMTVAFTTDKKAVST